MTDKTQPPPEFTTDQTISQLYAQQCAAEPIHLLGGVQPHGYLTVVSLVSGRFCQISSGMIRHYPGLESASELIDQEASDWIQSAEAPLDEILHNLSDQGRTNLNLKRRRLAGDQNKPAWSEDADCTGHRCGNYAILEWVPVENFSARALESIQATTAFHTSIAQPASVDELNDYLTESAAALQKLSGYQRVMIYRFLPDWSGEIIAEITRADTEQRYSGLRFPASDIPPQARELYLRNKLRVLADVNAEADRLIPERLPDGQILDQSLGLLRSMSGAHHAYLKNMQVRATLTISIIVDKKLWGMIACHHDQPMIPPNHLIGLMRSSAELLSSVISTRVKDLQRSEKQERLTHFRGLLNLLSAQLEGNEDAPKETIAAALPSMAEIMRSAHMATYVHGIFSCTWAISEPDEAKLLRKLASIRSMPDQDGVLTFQQLPKQFDELPGLPPDTAGLLLCPLNDHLDGFVLFTRREIVQEVKWAGKPEKFALVQQNGEIKLHPRNSFALWTEVSKGSCEVWTLEDIELATLAARRFDDISMRLNALRLQSRLEWASTHDALTSLLNRSGLEYELRQRLGRTEISLILLDLDNFKQINDTMGHEVGDFVLKEIAARLSASVRGSDVVVRHGGDEFVLLLERATSGSTSEINEVLERIRSRLATPVNYGGQDFKVGFSAGISSSPEHGTEPTTLLKRADLALYEAKKGGRARSVTYSCEMEKALKHQVDVENELSSAIKKGQLVLYYQPQIDLVEGRVVSFEALVRWNHPKLGIMLPGFFISVAEERDLIHELGRWVIYEGAAQIAAWNREIDPELELAVNVSFRQLREGTIVEDISGALAKFDVNPKNFHVELTESAVLGKPERSIEVNEQLKKLGVRIALDDFGTGYSSLSHLHDLQFDYLKIDRSFTMNLERDQHSKAVVSSLISLAESLNLGLVAEGIETRAQAAWLKNAGCSIGQGFYWSPAVEAAKVPELITRINAKKGLL